MAMKTMEYIVLLYFGFLADNKALSCGMGNAEWERGRKLKTLREGWKRERGGCGGGWKLGRRGAGKGRVRTVFVLNAFSNM